MYKRVWTPTVCERTGTESKITICDFGAYYGELVDDNWRCWEIVSRNRLDSGEIAEELRLMPQDWVPFDFYYAQTYGGHLSDNTMLIRGWSVQTSELKELDHPLPGQSDIPRVQQGRPQQQRPQEQRQRPQQPQQHQQRPQPQQHQQPQQHPQPQQRPQPQQHQQRPQPQQHQQRPQRPQRPQPQQRPQRPQPQQPQQHQQRPQPQQKIVVSPNFLRNTTVQRLNSTNEKASVQWTPLAQVVQSA